MEPAQGCLLHGFCQEEPIPSANVGLIKDGA